MGLKRNTLTVADLRGVEPETLLTPAEVAQVLRICRETVYNWISHGRLKARKIGPRSVRVTVAEVLRVYTGG